MPAMGGIDRRLWVASERTAAKQHERSLLPVNGKDRSILLKNSFRPAGRKLLDPYRGHRFRDAKG
jgi:hypothetical protein